MRILWASKGVHPLDRNIAEGLAARGHELRLFTLNRPAKPWAVPRMGPDVDPRTGPVVGPLAIRRACLEFQPDVVFANFAMTYLSGGDDFFGPDFGGAEVATNVRKGLLSECANTGMFLNNLSFTLALENEIMGAILNDGADPTAAAKAWLAAHPEALAPWLAGVTTKDGGDALAAVTAALK